jgi:hypothetical protein
MKTNRIIALLTIFFLSSSIMLMTFPFDVRAATPSAPEFTVAYVDHSYNVPITHWTTTDPYTGNQITHSSGGEHVDNRTIDVTIKNQPFKPYIDTSNNTVYLYYNIRSKGHYEKWNGDSDLGSHSQTGVQATTSTSTVVSFNIQNWNVPQGGQIDFQVKAVIGYTYYNSQSCGTEFQNIVGDSGWSNTQTITIGTPSTPNPTAYPVTTPTPTPFPQQTPTTTPEQPNILIGLLPDLSWEQTALIIMVVVVACFAVVVAVLLRKLKRK